MATSQKQIDANRRNAQKSTGAKTPETKAITRLNAKRDGITGQVLTLSEEDRPIFEALKAELIADLAPKTTMELRLANGIAWDTWRLDRLRAVEMNMYALGTQDAETTVDSENPQIDTAMSGALTFEEQSHKFALLSIYEQRLNRVASTRIWPNFASARPSASVTTIMIATRRLPSPGPMSSMVYRTKHPPGPVKMGTFFQVVKSSPQPTGYIHGCKVAKTRWQCIGHPTRSTSPAACESDRPSTPANVIPVGSEADVAAASRQLHKIHT